jgi:hypothetical protein
MADDITIKDGANADAVVATKDIGSREYQLVIPAFGSTPTLPDSATPFPVQAANSLFYNDTTTNQTNGTTFSATARDCGFAAGSLCPWNYFNFTAYNSHAATISIEMSNDNSTWYRACPDVSVIAGQAQTVSVPIVTRYYKIKHTQGATTSTSINLSSSFTVN